MRHNRLLIALILTSGVLLGTIIQLFQPPASYRPNPIKKASPAIVAAPTSSLDPCSQIKIGKKYQWDISLHSNKDPFRQPEIVTRIPLEIKSGFVKYTLGSDYDYTSSCTCETFIERSNRN